MEGLTLPLLMIAIENGFVVSCMKCTIHGMITGGLKMDTEYIIENITENEMDLLEDNGIDWCPDDMFGKKRDIVFFSEDEYERAARLLGRTR